MRRLARATLIGLLVALLAASGVGSTLAGNETAETAQVVSAETSTVGGELTGNSGGAYRYYRFAHPGANSVVRIHLNWDPGYWFTGSAFGFNVYGPNGLVGTGLRGDDVGSASTANLSIPALEPGEYLVQVYNYTAGSSHRFSLVFSGLGRAPTAPAAAPDNSTPERAAGMREQAPSMAGTLTGSSAGAFRYFTLEYPGASWPLTVKVTFSPASALPNDAIGFLIWEGDRLAATGQETSRVGEVVVKSATLNEIAPAPFGLQVYNYAPGVTASFVVDVAGLPTSPASASGNASPERALRLSPQQASYQGTVVGSSAGAYAFYYLSYQGGDEPFTLSVAFRPGRRLTGVGFGFNIYRGADRVGIGMLADGRTPDEGVAYITFHSTEAGVYGIQLYNYAPGVPVEYTIYALGLKQ